MLPLYPNSGSVNTNIINDLVKVSGINEAKNYPKSPNTRDVIWDKDENYFYIRTTDSNNSIVNCDRYSYEPAPEPKPEDLFVGKEEFNDLKGEIKDVKESIQQLISLTAGQSQTHNKSGNHKSGKANNSNAQIYAEG